MIFPIFLPPYIFRAKSHESSLTFGVNSGTIIHMAVIDKILAHMRTAPNNVRFADAVKVCDFYFGKPRHKGGSHIIYKTPWPGDPRVNIQKNGAKAKAYQVRQILAAIDKLHENGGLK